jgi:hypothetical protein
MLYESWCVFQKYNLTDLKKFIQRNRPDYKFQFHLPIKFQIFFILISIKKQKLQKEIEFEAEVNLFFDKLFNFSFSDRKIFIYGFEKDFILNPFYNLADLDIQIIKISSKGYQVKNFTRIEKNLQRILFGKLLPSESKTVPLPFQPKRIGGLNQMREIILALKGEKVSRITLPLFKAIQVIRKIGKGRVSHYFINSVLSNLTEDFCNVAHLTHFETCGFLDLQKDVYVYIASNDELSEKARCLDVTDSAGDLFQIPKCCQHYFKRNWEDSILTHEGDLFGKLLLNSNKKEVTMVSENFFPLSYLDNGYLYHFPCSLRCQETIDLVRERRKFFRNSEFTTTLDSNEIELAIYKPETGYGFFFRDGRFCSTNKKLNEINSLEISSNDDCIRIKFEEIEPEFNWQN